MEIYTKNRPVYWSILKDFGFFSSSGFFFSKITITPEYINFKALFWGHCIKKSDILNIEFTSSFSPPTRFSYIKIRTLFSKNNFCKITTNKETLPKWLAFVTTNEDIKKLKEFHYI